MESNIIAVRNGKQREFSRRQWDLMGTDKYGWEVVDTLNEPEVPKEVKKTIYATDGVRIGVGGGVGTLNLHKDKMPGSATIVGGNGLELGQASGTTAFLGPDAIITNTHTVTDQKPKRGRKAK